MTTTISATSSSSSSSENFLLLTPKQVFFHSAELLFRHVHTAPTPIAVQGTIVLLDLERHRMDIAEGGGKLIVRWSEAIDVSLLTEGTVVQATGHLKKEQRRTFLEADVVRMVQVDAGIPSVD